MVRFCFVLLGTKDSRTKREGFFFLFYLFIYFFKKKKIILNVKKNKQKILNLCIFGETNGFKRMEMNSMKQ